MPATPPKGPPKFVPTLTDVVQVSGDAVPGPDLGSETPRQAAGLASGSGSGPVPAREPAPVPAAPFTAMPTDDARPMASPEPVAAPSEAVELLPHTVSLVVPGPQDDAPAHAAPATPMATPTAVPPSAASPAGPAAPTLTAADFSGIEEMVIHRIIQRVDVVLDQRLREAIATVVQEQTRSMVPRLREEVESVVRHAVYEAVADELAAPGGPQR